jgi:hypothetical protein
VKGYGQVAFEAYANHVEWTNHAGVAIPPWDGLSHLTQQAWEEAALAAIYETETKRV